MKTLLIVFSQTGNTKKMALGIREGLESEGCQCDLVSLENVATTPLESYGLVGLGCPVFYYKEPFNVGDYILSLPGQSTQAGLDNCMDCGVCEESCPLQGIDLSSDPPVLQSPCIYCYMCVKSCPESAIEADWTSLVQMAPANYDRYIQALNEAEARSEFEWRMDPNTLDFTRPLHVQPPKRR